MKHPPPRLWLADRIRARCGVAWLLLCALICNAGCSRSHYRQQADDEAYRIIRNTATDPRWPLVRHTIQIDPASRMFSPFAPDYPPMPPDDPTSHEYMHEVDHKKGYPFWHANGDTSLVQNPAYLSTLPWTPDGNVRIDMDQAVQLALLHSPEYQEELEELYLSALDVSFERFRFDAQFFAGEGIFYTSDGEDRAGSGGRDISELNLTTFPFNRGIRVEKLSTTGAEMVIGLANSFIWQFSGPNTNDTTSLLDFAIVQPLLRRGGRARVMERLTIAERTMLANVRQMERFRREFYLSIVTGRPTGPGPERRGGFFGGSGLEGFTGVGGGGFGRVGSGGFGFAGGAGAPEAGGFIGLLQEQQNLRNQESNIAALRNSVIQLDAYFRAGRIDFFQVDLARQALLNAQSRWLNARSGYELSLDDYKRDLGVSPGIPMVIADRFLDQFRLIDSEMIETQNELARQQVALGESVVRLTDEAQGNGDTDVMRAMLRQIQTEIAAARSVAAGIVADLVPTVSEDIDQLEETIPSRRRSIGAMRQKFGSPEFSLLLGASDRASSTRTELSDIAQNAMDVEQLLQLPDELRGTLDLLLPQFQSTTDTLNQLRNECTEISEQLDELEPDVRNEQLGKRIIAPLPNQLRDLAAELQELSLVQARARTEAITLSPVELDWQTALEIASVNRRDWMNARANLVDSWRLIQFNANDLESDVDIIFTGDISTLSDNPVRFEDSTGRLRAGVQFDAPLTRLSERNTYRQSLIEYAQARRNYYEYEDRITEGLRETIRRLELNQLNFELLRSAVGVAISQVELAQLRLQEPPRPDLEVQETLGATTARDLVTALSALLEAQTDFLSVWVNYEVVRRGLDLDLGTMQLDALGNWIDPGPIRADLGVGELIDTPLGEDEISPEVYLEEAPDPDFDSLPAPTPL